MAKKSWKPRRSDVEDRATLQRRQELATKIKLIAENLGEDDFVSVIKKYDPHTTPAQLTRMDYAVSRCRAAETRAFLTTQSP
jgi:hypothetical protein